jgi:hypothetical protein
MRAPFRESPDWGWDDTPPTAPDVAPYLTITLEDDVEDTEGLVDSKGDPLYTEAPPFGFCSQRQDPA